MEDWVEDWFDALEAGVDAAEAIAPGRGWMFRDIARVGPRGEEEGGYFQPAAAKGRRAMRLYLGVRAGTAVLCRAEDWLRLAGLPDAGTLSEGAAQALRAHGLRAETEATFDRAQALFGADLVDVISVPLDADGPVLRLRGTADVIGAPQQPWEAPVRLRGSLRAWMRGAALGVALIGDAADSVRWLRGASGVVCDGVAQAQAMEAKLRRDYEMPRLLVAAGGVG
ncbi:MAG: hypothetical protein KGH75_00850 [Rhodospirillales bacterium]|nr:hypothetical protein [Rhodospirillales bacterium]